MASTQVSDAFSKANGEVGKRLQNAEGRLEKMSNGAGEKLGSMAAEFRDSATEYVKTGTEFVKENPIKGVAIAATAGLVAGSLLTLVMRRSH